MLEQITPLILTFNESANIGRTLAALSWAREVVIIDSFSTDDTLEIARSFPNTRVVQRRFDCFAHQWNYALREIGLQCEWVLALDADYGVTEEFSAELAGLVPESDVSGYWARFRYCIDGVPLRGSLYPPVIVLFRRRHARFMQDGHAYRVQLDSGRQAWLRSQLLHDDRKPFSRWLSSQRRYAQDEARKLASSSLGELDWPDRVRKVPLLAAPIVAGYCLFAKGCALDGVAGTKYVAQRAIAEVLISLQLLRRLRG